MFFINNILNILLYSLAHAEYWESDEANVCLLLVVLFAMYLLLVYWELFSAVQRLLFRGAYILCHWPLKLHFVLYSVFCDFCRWCVAVCLSFCLYGSVNADSVTSTSAMLWRLLLLLRMVMMTLTMLIMFMKFKSILNSILYRGFQIMFFFYWFLHLSLRKCCMDDIQILRSYPHFNKIKMYVTFCVISKIFLNSIQFSKVCLPDYPIVNINHLHIHGINQNRMHDFDIWGRQ